MLYTGVTARMLIKCSALIIIFLGRDFLFYLYIRILNILPLYLGIV